MSVAVDHHLLDAVAGVVAGQPAGIRLDGVQAALPEVARRTLQRGLARLVAAGRIVAVGRGAGRRYLPASGDEAGRAEGAWRSVAGLEVERLVRRPLHERAPAGYRRELLDRYRPNVDAYLPAALRRRLHELGRSPEGARPAGTFARQVLDRLLIDLSWASSRLEGNTYTRVDTQNLISFGRLAEGKDAVEAQMILNHKAAIELLVEDAEQVGFDRYTLLNLHALLADNLLADPDAAGRLRVIPVQISGTVYQPTGIPQVIEEQFDLFLAKARAIDDPFEAALFAMVHLPYLQPFEDVNKRVSRLAANLPLIRHNMAPLSFVDVEEGAYVEAILGVYELGRVELLRDLFGWAYERSCQRYTVLREALPTPDPLRLRYRAELAEVVREAVRGDVGVDAAALRERARGLVPQADVEAVVAMAVNELLRLHEGSVARFGVRLEEFRGWKGRAGRTLRG